MANGRGNPGRNSMRIKFDTKRINAGLDGITVGAEEAVRPAAQAGAEEFYFEALLRVPASSNAHYFYGKNSKQSGVRYYFEAGNLRQSIYQAYSKDNSGKSRATYHISWNHQKAPYGFMVEFGTSRAPAHPFMRPAYESRKEIALQVARAEMISRMQAVL